MVFSSAAVLTLGVATVPVYEIYKVGADPYWVEGLDVLSEVGLSVAVIPHYDNQEGGNHDTRFCYLGERRLAMLEPSLPDGAFVLGIDEHTGVIVDLDADTAEIVGKGAVTLRRHGVSMRIETGQTVSVDVLRAGPVAPAHPGTAPHATTTEPTAGKDAPRTATDSARAHHRLPRARGDHPRSCVRRGARGSQRRRCGGRHPGSRVGDRGVVARDTLQSDDVDRARAALRSMIVRLGAAASEGVRDVREVLGPVVEAALAARVVARSEKAFAVSDAIRDELVKAGIEVRDTPTGVEWLVVEN